MADNQISPNKKPASAPNGNEFKNNPKSAPTDGAIDEQLKKILEQMADKDPAYIAEIIHQWLNEDKK